MLYESPMNFIIAIVFFLLVILIISQIQKLHQGDHVGYTMWGQIVLTSNNIGYS